jgi:hypothetical protein
VKGMKGGQTEYNERINVVKAAWDGVDMTGKSVTMQSDLDRWPTFCCREFLVTPLFR